MNEKELARQVIERDIINIYRQIPMIASQSGVNIAPIMSLFEDKILTYLDFGIDTTLDWLFGADASGDLDEAADIAKMAMNDKVEEYRKKIREAKAINEANTVD